ncbi:hypothetical protein [Bordetella genomosp. 1]|uniref:Uncharacterized protein n=1 Tax=Bordetella genomosp. 1 TaxID=1395607 RepID=A0ABX4EZ68_9BORD|nr:hypothetical protein [Bordetella genomosp. 1]OZI58732.1 hypothetical protein CAL27_18800 [Bordetella genomosp. 1]
MDPLRGWYLAVGVVAAAVLYPWLVRRFGVQIRAPLARIAFFGVGAVLAWPILAALPVGEWFERRARNKKNARERAYQEQLRRGG